MSLPPNVSTREAAGLDLDGTSRPQGAEMEGVLRQDLMTRAAYVSDASNYRRFPAAVLEPRSASDIRAGILYARDRGWSIVARGGGTSVAGNAIGEGLIIDTSRYLNRILEIDPQARTARVQPGVVCDQLRAAAAAYGLTFGPDPSTHSRCTIGGMVANNACGSHSVAWGTSADNLVSMTMLLADGQEIRVTSDGVDDERVMQSLLALRDENLATIRTEMGRFPRQISGYGLHYLLPERGFDVVRAIAGSEGTLGVITELTVSLVERPAASALAVLAFPTVFDAAAAAPGLRRSGVGTIEGMGADLLEALRSRPGMEDAGKDLPGVRIRTGADGPGAASTAGGWLYCETTGADPAEAAERARELAAATPGTVDTVVVTDESRARALWAIREAGAGIATRLPDGSEAWPGWEDSAVPPEHLAVYLQELYALMAAHGVTGIPFGHFGEGCVHLRLSFEPGTEEGTAAFRDFMTAAATLVARHGGSLSGEHGDGRARSELLDQMYSPQALLAFRRFKATFDPGGVMNPGVLVDPEPLDDRLRPGPGQRRLELTPVQAFTSDRGSMVTAVNRCVGVGACRSMDGAMCPSFQITGDEVHSTRGRARLLSEMFRGETIAAGYDSVEVKNALDLCLSCRACSTDCPVNVDMATYKAEFLHGHFAHRLRPAAHYSMGWLPLSLALLHRLPGAASILNLMLSLPRVEGLAKRLGGVDRSRPMIRFAPRSFQTLHRRRGTTPGRGMSKSAVQSTRPTVVLWPDSFTNHLDTEPGTAAVQVLEALGYRVIIPRGFVCCGLTWHSTGQLHIAQRVLRHTLDIMAPYVDAGLPVVGLEPSCTVMLRHDISELLPEDPRAAGLAAAVIPLGELIARHLPPDHDEEGSNELPAPLWPFQRLDVEAVTQVHCHERSSGERGPAERVLAALGVSERGIKTGCCGLAGNWGFEPGHADLSRALGERELFPAVRERKDGDVVLADGFSCRTQVQQGTGVRALHLAEILAWALTGRTSPISEDDARPGSKCLIEPTGMAVPFDAGGATGQEAEEHATE